MPFESKFDLQETILKLTEKFKVRMIVVKGWGLETIDKLAGHTDRDKSSIRHPTKSYFRWCGPSSTTAGRELPPSASGPENPNVLFVERGEEAYFGAFGHADREAGTPMDRDAIVQIYSMTKPVTGVALMTLWEDGAFDLDDPLADYPPEFADLMVYAGEDADGQPILEAPRRPVTIRDLTRHTAGIGADGGHGLAELLREADAMNRENTLEEMARRFASVPLGFHPGEQWAYGPSVDLQAFLVERISGQPYGEYVREHVLGPLGLSETRYVVPEADRDRMAAVYRRGGDGTLSPIDGVDAFNTRAWPLTPGGWGLTSTIDDYSRFAQMLLHGGALDGVRILQPETVRLMATSGLDDAVTERMWLPSKGQVGFGIDVAVRVRPPAAPDENPGTVGEFFWDGAASTLFWVDPVNELTAVLLVQLMPFDGVGLHHGVREAVYGPFRPRGS